MTRRTFAFAWILAHAAWGCSTPPTTPTDSAVQSYLPIGPQRLTQGISPDYSGTWTGFVTQTACSSSVAGFCRINPVPAAVSWQIFQNGSELTIDARSGYYVTVDFGVYGRSADGGLLLHPTTEGLAGISVGDTYRDGVLIRSTRATLSLVRSR